MRDAFRTNRFEANPTELAQKRQTIKARDWFGSPAALNEHDEALAWHAVEMMPPVRFPNAIVPQPPVDYVLLQILSTPKPC